MVMAMTSRLAARKLGFTLRNDDEAGATGPEGAVAADDNDDDDDDDDDGFTVRIAAPRRLGICFCAVEGVDGTNSTDADTDDKEPPATTLVPVVLRDGVEGIIEGIVRVR